MQHLVGALLQIVHRVAHIGALYIVQVDNILACTNRQSLRRCTIVIVTCNVNLFISCGNRISKGLASDHLSIMQHLVGALLQIVHRVAQVVALCIVQIDNILIRTNRQSGFIRTIVGVAVNINGFISCANRSSKGLIINRLSALHHFVGVLLQIVHRVAQIGALYINQGNGEVKYFIYFLITFFDLYRQSGRLIKRIIAVIRLQHSGINFIRVNRHGISLGIGVVSLVTVLFFSFGKRRKVPISSKICIARSYTLR